MFRIILNNVKKIIPTIKDTDAGATYQFPFAKANTRACSLDLFIRDTPGMDHIIERYLRASKVYSTIDQLRLPISIDLGAYTEWVYNTGGVGTHSLELIRIRIRTNIWRSDYLETFMFILKFPAIIKMIATLHRKAYFNDTVTAGLVEDDIPF